MDRDAAGTQDPELWLRAPVDRVLLIEDGAVALDERIDLPPPRSLRDARFARIEERILERVLGAGDRVDDLASTSNARRPRIAVENMSLPCPDSL